jgi:uncharacterized protein YndB with AHSA1/START domain
MARDDGVTREVLLPATRADVWAALTEPARVSKWFGGSVAIDARPRGEIEARSPDGRRRHGIVVAVNWPYRLVIEWAAQPVGEAEVEVDGPPPTRVEFVLDETPDGTRLIVNERQLSAEPSIGFLARALR